MKISELIEKLEIIKNKEGDLNVCTSEDHEYWGRIESYLADYDIRVSDAQPNSPQIILEDTTLNDCSSTICFFFLS